MIDRELINLLKIKRRQKGLTLVELAQSMGVPPAWLTQVETGEIVPTQEEYELIKKYVEADI